jgi:GNAT superfamily N-acetyltransferase
VDIRTVDPTEAAATSAMDSYFAELDRRFPDGFDPGPAAVGDMVATTGGAFALATSDGVPVACGGVRSLGDGVGEIKRMWVHHGWRGAGLGSRLLRHLETTALDLGYATVRLDTNGTLTEAIAMYDRAGYRPIERYNDNLYAQAFFEKSLRPAR